MILTVIDKKQETRDIFSLILEKPKNFKFYPGQFLDIELPVYDPLGKSRIFSLSSSPSEDFLMLTYKTGPSPYKKALNKLKKGDLISSTHPAGTVVIDDSSPIVFLSGGIGIAPHRSMIKWAVDRKLNLSITLIYSNSDPDFIFQRQLQAWAKQYPKLKIYYIITSQDGRLSEEKIRLLLPKYSIPASRGELNTVYYLAGPPKMVDDFENILLNLAIDETSIRTDRFDGY